MRYLLVILLILSSGTVSAADSRHNFYKANNLYEEGRYNEAIDLYEGILRSGEESGPLYYNLGNSYFKIGDTGHAILNYERAERFIPNDGDLTSNLGYVRSRLTSPVSAIKSPLLRMPMTIDGITTMLSVIYFSIFVVIIAAIFVGRIKRFAPYITAVLILFSIIPAYNLYERVSHLGIEAVIVTGSIEARFEPIEQSTIHFTIYEGAVVDILQTDKAWSKIRRSDGQAGWVKDSGLEKLY